MMGNAPKFDKRQKHQHFLVVITFIDGDSFGRVYINHDQAKRFAKRQKRSPTVKSIRVIKLPPGKALRDVSGTIKKP